MVQNVPGSEYNFNEQERMYLEYIKTLQDNLAVATRELALTPEEHKRIEKSYRASGENVCKKCGLTYYKHRPYLPAAKTSGTYWLREICTGDLVKL